MALVDERGRIFGRYNLLDAAIAVMVIGLVPIGYAAYILFKVPAPVITAIEPATIQSVPEFRVTIRGEHLRPYMRVSFNDMQARAFFFLNETTAEAVFGDIPLGTYDVVLYDVAQERGRLPKAVTITAPALPPADLVVAGYFTTLDATLAPKITKGLTFPAQAEVLEVGRTSPDVGVIANGAQPVEIPVARTVRLAALLKVHCGIQADAEGVGRCRQGPPVNPGMYLMLDQFGRKLPFLVTEIRAAVEPDVIEVLMRPSAAEPALALVKVGDVDVTRVQNEFAGGARVTAVSPSTHDITLRIPAYPSSAGWAYATMSLRVGASMLFVTDRYQLAGVIMSVPPLPAKPR
jgi:hypothetical protein